MKALRNRIKTIRDTGVLDALVALVVTAAFLAGAMVGG